MIVSKVYLFIFNSENELEPLSDTKGQIISECPYEIIVCPKIATQISKISALASKERSNQKNKGTLLY